MLISIKNHRENGLLCQFQSMENKNYYLISYSYGYDIEKTTSKGYMLFCGFKNRIKVQALRYKLGG